MGNDREIDDETAALLTYLATPDGMEILKSRLSAVVSGVLIIGACFLWWPESEIAKGVVQIVGALTVFGLLSAVRGAWILYRDGMSVPPPELAWMTHNLAPEDPRAKIIAGHLAREAEKRAARHRRRCVGMEIDRRRTKDAYIVGLNGPNRGCSYLGKLLDICTIHR
jgi:hypothetical protein